MAMTQQGDLTAEVIVVGGGPAGLTMAAALAGAGVPVACIDRDSPAVQTEADFDFRTTAVAFGARQILAGTGVWRHLAERAAAILAIRVADAGAPLFIHYDHRQIGDTPLGYIVENRDLRLALFARAAELPGLTHLAPTAVARIERDRRGVRVVLDDGRAVRGRLVIGADGRHSLCRRQAGIAVTTSDYRQTAIICNIAHELPHHGLAVERFLPTGPFAVLPLVGRRSSIVWSLRRDRVPALMALPEPAFAAELQRHIGSHLGAVRLETPRAHYPLSVLLAHRCVAERLALIGEAAHAIHPVAGQGLNLSLRDVAALAEAIVDARRLGLDVGAPDVLARFQRWRRFDTLALLMVCDGLVRLFSNDLPPLRLARDLGLAAVDRLPPLKRLLMRHAMGMVGDLPRLIKGEPL